MATRPAWRHVVRAGLLFATTLALLCAGRVGAAGQSGVLGGVVARLGTVDEPEEEVFGWISGALRGPAGEIVVMDEQARQLRLFGPDGLLLDVFGREGAGPEEFGGDALAIALADDGRILVADSRNLRVSTIRLDGGRLRFAGSARTPFAPLDVCALQERTFVFSSEGEHLVREIDADGSVVRAFAPREKPTGRLAAQLGDTDHFLNHAHLDCDPSTGTVVLAHTFHPVVRAFSAEGVERWRTELGDYRQQQFKRSPDGRCCLYLIPDPRTGTYHVGEDVVVDDVGRILITLRESGVGPRPDDYELRVLAVLSGREVGHQDVTGVIRSARGRYATIAIREPYPQVELREWGRSTHPSR